MQLKEDSMQEQNKLDWEKRDRKLTYANEETDQSKLKKSPQGSLLPSHIFN